MLPKIHKNSTTPPGRPIVSSCDCPTEKISQFVDIILQEYAKQGRSYIKDSPDFIDKLTDIILQDDNWLFTMDVSGLYTNIPHTEGLQVIEDIVKNRSGKPNGIYILKCLELVLKGNVF